MYILGYNSLTEIASVPCKSRFAGSGSLSNYGDIIYRKDKSKRPYEIKGNIYKNYLQTLKYCDILDIPINELGIHEDSKKIANYADYVNRYRDLSNFIHTPVQQEKKTYKINKAKVRKRLTALCRLDQSKKFLAFYSVTFPSQSSDKVIYQIFNKWLTNCRTRYGLTTYVWVAERQKNGTLHFHILTNNRMDISKVNRAMANSIETSVNQGLAEWGSSSKTLYNGVDVDSVQTPKKRQYETREQYRKRIKAYKRHSIYERIKWATLYMTKYLTKNNDTFEHLPYHCSRDISQLFTSVVLSDNDAENYIDMLNDEAENYNVIDKGRMTIYVFKEIQPDKVYEILDKLNNMLYNMYRQEHDRPPEERDMTKRQKKK